MKCLQQCVWFSELTFHIKSLFFRFTVVDLVLIMSVNPGFGGQSFIESQVKKISDLRRLCAEKVVCKYLFAYSLASLLAMLEDLSYCLFISLQGVNPWIEVDGGVGPKNAYKVIISLHLSLELGFCTSFPIGTWSSRTKNWKRFCEIICYQDHQFIISIGPTSITILTSSSHL